eukprot:gene9184-10884_t
MGNKLLLVFLCGVVRVTEAAYSIDDFGARSGFISDEAAINNGMAIHKAIITASSQGREVLVPAGSIYNVLSSWDQATKVSHLRLIIDGILVVQPHLALWDEVKDANNDLPPFLHFVNCDNVTITGTGHIQGLGYEWWNDVIFHNRRHNQRPTLLSMKSCRNVLLENFRLLNGPRFHTYLTDMLNLTVRGLHIKTDVARHKKLLAAGGHMTTTLQGLLRLPTFPLNTDGIDVAGKNIHIYNVTVENFDDAICAKPQTSDGVLTACTENFLAENISV